MYTFDGVRHICEIFDYQFMEVLSCPDGVYTRVHSQTYGCAHSNEEKPGDCYVTKISRFRARVQDITKRQNEYSETIFIRFKLWIQLRKSGEQT